MKVVDRQLETEEGVACSPAPGAACIPFFVLLPIIVCCKLTLPDVKAAGKAYWYPVTVIFALAWMGGASYFLVRWASLIASVLGVPPAVMGLTFLAAGTSMPSLLTAVVLARRGEADAAISASMGARLFPLLVGLPVPWVVSCVRKGSPVIVASESLYGSLLVLFGVLMLVMCTVSCFRWRMTQCLGYCLCLFYASFIFQDMARAYGYLTIPYL
mmetsp:Transcript_37041/g.98111  ORF Transcript_37041/g.98111 Transcript_37041/m.98111 type:complete len:214 (+) Transcript_37041:795-1436(+)